MFRVQSFDHRLADVILSMMKLTKREMSGTTIIDALLTQK